MLKPTILAAAVLTVVALVVPAPGTNEATPTPTPTVHDAIRSGLESLGRNGAAWIEKHKCASCHQVPVMVWAHHEAVRGGFTVDSGKLDEWTRFAVTQLAGSKENDGANQLILGLDLDPSATEELVQVLVREQRADGSWSAGGQLPTQRRPVDETHRVSSMWSVHALNSLNESDATGLRGRELVASWLREEDAGTSNESLALRLILAHELHERQSEQRYRTELLSRQQADGGWSWLHGEPSDALATGQTLYALQQVGFESRDPVVLAATQFLVETQRADGSWEVRSTLAEKHGPRPTSNDWGTGWAVIGLLRSLPGQTDYDAVRSSSRSGTLAGPPACASPSSELM